MLAIVYISVGMDFGKSIPVAPRLIEVRETDSRLFKARRCSGHLIESEAVMAEKNDAAEGASTFSHRVAEKADRIKYVAVAVVVILVAGLIIFNYQRRASAAKRTEAGNKVFQTVIDVRTNPGADAVSLFGAAAKEFSGLPGGAQAQLLQFAFAYNTGKYAEAERAAKDFIRDYPASSLVNRVKMALGQALLMQDKLTEAISTFRDLVTTADPEIFPGSKLGLAQSLEKDAEAVRDDEIEYRRRLELAETEYNDIIVRSRITIAAQRGYWPQAVVLPADYALVLIKDKLAGHEPGVPSSMVPAQGPTEMPASLPVPTDTPANDEAAGEASTDETGEDETGAAVGEGE